MRLRTSFVALVALTALASAHDGDPKGIDPKPSYSGPGWRNSQRLATAGGGGLNLTMGPSFPSSNVTLLSWMSLPEFNVDSNGRGSNCWGYVAPSGREYAIFGNSRGTAFVEVTQPGNPRLVAQIPGPTSEWRDPRVFQDFCYVVSEGGNGIHPSRPARPARNTTAYRRKPAPHASAEASATSAIRSTGVV